MNDSAEWGLFEGGVLRAHAGVITGWVWDQLHPNSTMEVEVFANGILLGSARANRRVLGQPETVRAPHGFELKFEPPAFLVPPYDIRARVVGEQEMLDGIVKVSSLEEHYAGAADHAGEVIGLADGALEGWVVCRSSLDRNVTVVLVADDTIVATANANRIEPMSALYGSGHGFRLKIPDILLDGKAHQVRVGVEGAMFELTGSPYSFALLPLAVVWQRLDRLERGLEQMQHDKADQAALVEDLYLRVGGDLSRRFDALIGLQRDSFEAEVSVLRTLLNQPSDRSDRESAPKSRAISVMDDSTVGYGWYPFERDSDGRAFRWMPESSTSVLDFSSPWSARVRVEGYMALDAVHIPSLKVHVNGVLVEGSVDGNDDGWTFEGRAPAHAFRGSRFSVVKLSTGFARQPDSRDGRKLSISVRAIELSVEASDHRSD